MSTSTEARQVDDRGGLVYGVRGHVSAEEFAGAVASFEGYDEPRRVRWLRHEWERCVPSPDGVMLHEARPHSRGAYRVSVGEIERRPE